MYINKEEKATGFLERYLGLSDTIVKVRNDLVKCSMTVKSKNISIVSSVINENYKEYYSIKSLSVKKNINIKNKSHKGFL